MAEALPEKPSHGGGVNMERTFVMVKPDGVERRLVGEIIRRFENRGLRLVGLKLLQPDRALAEKHYAVHREKPFFQELVDFITGGPVVAMVLEGNQAILLVRNMMGALKPENAQPGTIRGDFTTDIQTNLVHGSDAPETAQSEIALWFKPEELL
jgi:nucleoside-diphosphate kinase